jgi:hypothetical protein
MIPRVATAGKTPLAKAIFPDKLYVSLENPDVLTGSAQFDLIFGVTQPLAGHVGRIEVIPMSASELVAAGKLPETLEAMLLSGSPLRPRFARCHQKMAS